MQVLLTSLLLFALFSFPAMAGSSAIVDHVVVYKHDRKLVLLSRGDERRNGRVMEASSRRHSHRNQALKRTNCSDQPLALRATGGECNRIFRKKVARASRG